MPDKAMEIMPLEGVVVRLADRIGLLEVRLAREKSVRALGEQAFQEKLESLQGELHTITGIITGICVKLGTANILIECPNNGTRNE